MDYPTTITGHTSKDRASAHREDGNFVVWLMRMARNAYNDYLRNRHRRPAIRLDELADDTGADSVVLEESAGVKKVEMCQEEMSVLLTLINQLPTRHRAVLLIVDVHGYSHAEAVQLLELPLDTLKTRLCRARVALRDRLVEVGQVPGCPA